MRFTTPLDGRWNDLPIGWQVSARGSDWFRYQTRQPDQDNPLLLRHLMQQQLKILSLQPVNRSLERVYLQAINAPEEAEAPHAA